MKSFQGLGLLSIFCVAASLGGWGLVYAGMNNAYPGGDPGWGNLFLIVVGLAFVLAFGMVGVVFGLAALSERRLWLVIVALTSSVLTLLAVPVFLLCTIFGVFDPYRETPPPRTPPVAPTPGITGAVRLGIAPYEVSGIYVHDDLIYGTSASVTDRDNDDTNYCIGGDIWVLARNGGEVRLIAADEWCPYAPGRVGNHLYWGSNGAIFELPIGGVPSRFARAENGPLVFGRELVYGDQRGDVIAYDPATESSRVLGRGHRTHHLFAGSEVYGVRTIVDARGSEIVRVRDGRVLASFPETAWIETADEREIIVAVGAYAGSQDVLAIAAEGGEPRHVFTTAEHVRDLAVAGDDIYIATGSTVLRADRSGRGIETMVQNARMLRSLHVAGSWLYFVADEGGIYAARR